MNKYGYSIWKEKPTSRLIDADAFKDSVAKEVVKDLGNVSILTIGKALGRTPTVEAIPIEWLNKVIEHYRENGWHDDAEDLELLINDWREEQKNE